MASTLHEDLSHKAPVKISTARNFGLWFALIFALIGLSPLRNGQPVRIWALAVGAVFLVSALVVPAVLQPLNVAWSKVGLLLARVVNPIVMAVIFFGVVTPIGAFLRSKKKDLLRLQLDPGAESYWIRREAAGSLTKQY
jgi:ABC-type transport system involved in cytochrome c biogenesis permease component